MRKFLSSVQASNYELMVANMKDKFQALGGFRNRLLS